jgi:CheY-like chemotaxis protein
MPGMDGIEVMKRLRTNELTQSIPIAFATISPEKATQMPESGVVAVFAKPLIPSALRAWLIDFFAAGETKAA